jgi:hypothetical protein
MILTALTPVYYPTHIGNREIFVGTGNGPTSYNATSGDPLSVNFIPFFIDSVLGPCISVSGNYVVLPQIYVSGKGGSWVLYWYAFNKATGALTAASGNLSAEVVQLGVVGGA